MHKSAYNKDNWLLYIYSKACLLEGGPFQFFDFLPSQLKEARRDVEVVTTTDVDNEARAGNSLLQMLRFGHKVKPLSRL